MSDIGAPGASQGGQGSGMGSGHGNGMDGAEAEHGAGNFDGGIGGMDSAEAEHGAGNFDGAGMDATEAEHGAGNFDGVSVDYGAYDNPAYDSAAVEAQVMGPPSMQSPAYDSTNVEAQVMGQTFAEQQAKANEQARAAQEQAMDAAYHSGQLGTPAPAPEANPNLISRYDQRQFYSALDDDDATEEAKALEIQGFLNHISRKNYTDTGFLSQFGIRSPQLTEREQIAQVKNFLGKHQSAIDALNKSYTDQINQNPGLRQALPGYGLITGLMSLIGLEPQHTHPAVQDLYDKMTELGMIEKETPEMTDAQKIEKCNATPGYRWDSAKHACVRIEGGSTTSSAKTSSTEAASVASPEQAGIVWKPVSESDGNLVILTPSSFDSASVTITDAEGNVIDTGTSMGRTNGNRHTYRFSMPGAGYGNNVYLNIGSRRYLINNGAARIN